MAGRADAAEDASGTSAGLTAVAVTGRDISGRGLGLLPRDAGAGAVVFAVRLLDD
jgi:hypothetical protein